MYTVNKCLELHSQGNRFSFLFITMSRLASGLGSLSPEVKWLEHEADHSPPSSAEVRKTWSFTSASPEWLHGIVLGDRDKFSWFIVQVHVGQADR
jgi:hypothetical protein